MARACPICIDERRADIEKAMTESGRPRHEISAEFGIPKHKLDNHASHIVPIDGTIINEANEIGKLRALVEPLLKDKDPKIRLAAIGRLESLTTLEARIGQEASAQQSLTANPAWELIRTHLLNIINECDRCRKAVLEAMPPGDTRGE